MPERSRQLAKARGMRALAMRKIDEHIGRTTEPVLDCERVPADEELRGVHHRPAAGRHRRGEQQGQQGQRRHQRTAAELVAADKHRRHRAGREGHQRGLQRHPGGWWRPARAGSSTRNAPASRRGQAPAGPARPGRPTAARPPRPGRASAAPAGGRQRGGTQRPVSNPIVFTRRDACSRWLAIATRGTASTLKLPVLQALFGAQLDHVRVHRHRGSTEYWLRLAHHQFLSLRAKP